MSKTDEQLRIAMDNYNFWAMKKEQNRRTDSTFCKMCDNHMDRFKKEIKNLSKKDE